MLSLSWSLCPTPTLSKCCSFFKATQRTPPTHTHTRTHTPFGLFPLPSQPGPQAIPSPARPSAKQQPQNYLSLCSIASFFPHMLNRHLLYARPFVRHTDRAETTKLPSFSFGKPNWALVWAVPGLARPGTPVALLWPQSPGCGAVPALRARPALLEQQRQQACGSPQTA